jgi:radical SAM superfamily enzyme YgiQ (UPF0313 family)
MKILLVFPSHLDEQGQPVKYQQPLIPSLALAILDRLTPKHHTVQIVSDVVASIDFAGDYDLVGITVMTIQSERAYQIADQFRQRGVPVVLGGIHPSLLPAEAKQHADAVVIGEAENLWEQVLDDCERHKLQEFYRAAAYPDLQTLVIPRWDHFNLRLYPRSPGLRLPLMPIFTSRGCPFNCKFCSLSKFSGHTYRLKPVAHVLREIEAMKARHYFFTDDNLACEADYARELFHALARQKIRWVSQVSTTILKHPDLIELAAKGGCTALIMGLESINQTALRAMHKGFNSVDHYAELFARMLKVRIAPFPSFIFGLDDDPPDQFRLTLDFLKQHRIHDALFWILTPYPGTELFAEMAQAGRIDHQRWSLFDAAHVVFQPKHFTRAQLQELYWQTYRRHYSWSNLLDYTFQSRLSLLVKNLLVRQIVGHKVAAREHPTAFGVGRLPSPPCERAPCDDGSFLRSA